MDITTSVPVDKSLVDCKAVPSRVYHIVFMILCSLLYDSDMSVLPHIFRLKTSKNVSSSEISTKITFNVKSNNGLLKNI